MKKGMENPKQEFVYGSCTKNQVAKLGGHATDGCGEFFSINNGSQCGACGCHRNFHLKIAVMRRGGSDERKGESSGEEIEEEKNLQEHQVVVYMRRGRRPRTKFTEEQRQRMFEFAVRLGWRMQRDRRDEIDQFCQQIGVPRHVFRVWLNNHKNH